MKNPIQQISDKIAITFLRIGLWIILTLWCIIFLVGSIVDIILPSVIKEYFNDRK